MKKFKTDLMPGDFGTYLNLSFGDLPLQDWDYDERVTVVNSEELDKLELDYQTLKDEVEGTNRLAADPSKWGLRACYDGAIQQRDFQADYAQKLNKVVKDLRVENTQLSADNARLKFALEAFASTAEAAVEAFESKDRGGMHVPFHGDFAHTTPSVISRLRWWAKQFRHVLSGKDWDEK
jgi:hypothetical protein